VATGSPTMREFVDQMPQVQTEKAMLADCVLGLARQRAVDPLHRA